MIFWIKLQWHLLWNFHSQGFYSVKVSDQGEVGTFFCADCSKELAQLIVDEIKKEQRDSK